MTRLQISELSSSDFTGTIEICGKIIYVDVSNKNILIKGNELIKL